MSPTADIKASDVQKLRQITGAGLMDCKKALVESGGDTEKAIKVLREKGIAKSSKRADRVAGEGLVSFWTSDDQKEGLLFELNCETDFVARNEEFIALSKKLMEEIRKNPDWTSADQLPNEDIQAFSGKIGEKIQPRRFARMKVSNGIVAGYIHMGSKLGVLIELETDKDVKASEGAKELGRELALQIAGASPSYVRREEVPADVIEREKEITKKQMEGQKKPPEILEKIATGKLQQYYSLHCLLEQPHVKDATGKTKIQEVVDQFSKKEGVQFKVNRFARFLVGAE